MEAERESKTTQTLRQTRMVGLEDRRRRLIVLSPRASCWLLPPYKYERDAVLTAYSIISLRAMLRWPRNAV